MEFDLTSILGGLAAGAAWIGARVQNGIDKLDTKTVGIAVVAGAVVILGLAAI